MTHLPLATVLFLVTAVHALDELQPPGDVLQSLKHEQQKILENYSQAWNKAQTDDEKRQLIDARQKQMQACARRALQLAQAHPKDLAAFDALEWIVKGG